ncbi:MAG: hypothetical protein CL868_20815 [Cytophagaceae bacterium]|nr:hypothetical protein [Cytophagaceae bacterium]|tara:strand:- start:3887 stop:4261 length:375 start_codon:yes stop_codon:yes gene_type:complete
MGTLYDLANICAGLILSISLLDRWDGEGNFFKKVSATLSPFAAIIGGICLVLGIVFLLRPFCAFHDITGIVAGLTLLSGSLSSIPGVGNGLEKLSRSLNPYRAVIGMIALIVGILGLLNITILC